MITHILLRQCFRNACFALVAFAGVMNVAMAQSIGRKAPAPGASSPSAAASNPITLTRSVEPSFHIEPIVHRFAGRRGETIPFQFEIASLGKQMDVVIAPVDLRQEENGIIMHREGNVTTDQIRILTATEFQLAPGDSEIIRGEVTIPLAKTNFLSYGILVKDRGQVGEKSDTTSDTNRTTAAIRFVTQYVLRIDIETGVQDISEMNKLVIDAGRIDCINGMPIAHAYIENPTDYSLECFARGTIDSHAASKPRPFNMNMPCRRDLDGDARYLIRLLPHSRIRLEAAVDTLMFPGKQTFRVELTNGRRSVVQNDFLMEVQAGDFPALDVKLAFLGKEVSVEPAQIEVGHVTGTSRTANLKFTNSSDVSETIRIAARDFDGQPVDALRLSDVEFEIKPGRTKTIRATLDSAKSNVTSLFGYIDVLRTSKPDVVRSLPLAMMFAAANEPNLEVGELQLVTENGYSSFQLQVTNCGQGFVPVRASLSVDDGKGRATEMADGYGRWLAPDETRVLKFDPRMRLNGGEHQLSLNIQTYLNSEPLRKTLVITIAHSEADTITMNPPPPTPPAS